MKIRIPGYFTAQDRWVEFWSQHPPIPSFAKFLQLSAEDRISPLSLMANVNPEVGQKIHMLNSEHCFTILKAIKAKRDCNEANENKV